MRVRWVENEAAHSRMLYTVITNTSWFTVIAQKTLIGKSSRRFNELDPENLHRYSMSHYEKTDGRGFFIFFFAVFRGSQVF